MSWSTEIDVADTRRQAGLLGILYAEDFDDAGTVTPTEAALAPEAAEPQFSAAELEAAREDGRRLGRVEAEHGLAASRSHMVGLLNAGVADADAAARQVVEETAEGVARCLLGALAACLPALCERHGATELRAVVRAVLPALQQEPRILVRVHPHMLDAMRAEIVTLDAELCGRVDWEPTESVAPGDARILWAGGAAARDARRARSAIADVLSTLGLAECHTNQQEAADA